MHPRSRMVLAGIVVVAAVLRLATLDVQSYWFDEAITVKLLEDSLGGMLGAIPDSESTPPLYYFLAWFWSKLVGTGEVGLRSLSALLGIATVAVAYLVAIRWGRSERIALIAALLVAVNPLLVWYSQEARAYALLVLLTAATLAVLPRALEPRARAASRAASGGARGRVTPLVAWAVLAALALATHYFALFLVVPEAIWLLRRRGREAVGALVGVGVVGLALLPLAIGQAENDGARFIRESSFGSRLVALTKQMLVGYDAPGEAIATAVGLAVAVAALVLLLTRTTGDEQQTAARLALLGGASVAIPLVLAIVGIDYLITRNVIVALVPLLVVLAIGLGTARAGIAGPVAAAALAAVSVFVYVGVASDARYQRDDWRGVAKEMGPPRAPRAIVVSPFNGRDVLELYLPGASKTPQGAIPQTVDEINVIAVNGRGPGLSSDTPRAPSKPPPPGFREDRRVEADTYTLVVYRADTPTPVATADLRNLTLTPGVPELVTQDPSARR